ncbi:hypothetical protein LPJ78_004132 [Coemansia sp. RSA 989]|nr:hypothetical protein LPJ68_002152 [Coemansia sp. RSA 1086]KAJ1752538.1 hypothetical protein LPJ79_001171 [Coemansia sp. RSA 1821]KAJ1863304.1 hypothetical protein LPJ78_004132 [Coemansia sp. RSA 989]KAJ1874639.1 hypothetical protein LPJ55_001372 [Coemansia sp. RSA 990]KAJ2671134.1 hypothetical protein IWW42_003543 [Coemansia sp. RSA 1085]
MNPFKNGRMPDPQDCVKAGTLQKQPPTVVEQDACPTPRHQRGTRLDQHYTVQTECFVEPQHHPNAGIGGYREVPRQSDIGGYYEVARESEIGNDHVDSGGYPIRHFFHKLCRLGECHHSHHKSKK